MIVVNEKECVMADMPMLPVRVPIELKEAVAKAAAARLQTMSEFVRDAVRDRLMRQDGYQSGKKVVA